jgi:hypothetical protein
MATTTKLQKAQAEVSRLWNLMCAEEGVPVNAKFVVFTSTNSHAASYNLAVKKFFRIRSGSSQSTLRQSYQAVS